MGIYEKILNRSNSYKYYKSEYHRLNKLKRKQDAKIRNLENQIKEYEQMNESLKRQLDQKQVDIKFLRQELINKIH